MAILQPNTPNTIETKAVWISLKSHHKFNRSLILASQRIIKLLALEIIDHKQLQ
jgi:hypothetical protein